MTNYPPKDWQEASAYPTDDVYEGWMDYSTSDPEPGENRPPGYRWGWSNARGNEFDGLQHIRRELARRYLARVGR